MILAMAGRARSLVIETSNPQIASPKTTAMTIRLIHILEFDGNDSRTGPVQNLIHGFASFQGS